MLECVLECPTDRGLPPLACSFEKLKALLDERCLVLSPFCGGKDCEGNIKGDSAGTNPSKLSTLTPIWELCLFC